MPDSPNPQPMLMNLCLTHTSVKAVNKLHSPRIILDFLFLQTHSYWLPTDCELISLRYFSRGVFYEIIICKYLVAYFLFIYLFFIYTSYFTECFFSSTSTLAFQSLGTKYRLIYLGLVHKSWN